MLISCDHILCAHIICLISYAHIICTHIDDVPSLLQIRFIQRRLRHGVTSEDEAFVAHRGHYSHGRTYERPVCIGEGCGGHSGLSGRGHRTHSAHHYETQKQQESDYKNWQHNHHPHSVHVSKRVEDDYKHWKNHPSHHQSAHHYCAWGPGDCDGDEADVLDNFFDDYDKKDIKVIVDFLRSDAYDAYVESEDYN